MKIQSLQELLYSKLKWHPARICTFYNLIIAVLSGGSVKIKDMAQYIETKASLPSKVVKLERWFLKQKLDYSLIGKIIVGLLVCSIGKVTIAIDRTNWQYGKRDLNFLVASIICGNISIPVVWLLLDKKGSSSSFERIELIDKLLAVIAVSRVKKNEQLRHENGGKMKLGRYFKDMMAGERKERRCRFCGEILNITCLQLEREQLLVVSNIKIGELALIAYKQRWGIERAFKALKKSGFWMEETHITDLEKLGKLMAILSIALAVAVLGGKIKNSIMPIRLKKHGRPQWSVFTYGLDWLISAFIHKNDAFLRKLHRLLDNTISAAYV
jgi:hypothetical protein